MTTPYSSHGYGANAVKYKGWRVVDHGVGRYSLTSPHTAPGDYMVRLYIADNGCDYRTNGGQLCTRGLHNKKIAFTVIPAAISAVGTTGAVKCQSGPAASSTCWLTAGMPVEVAVTARDAFGNPTLRAGDASKLEVSVCVLAESGRKRVMNSKT